MFNLGPHLRFGVFDLASHTPDQTLFSVLSIAAGTRGNRPNCRAVLIPGLCSFRAFFQRQQPNRVIALQRRANEA
jgi:hypothetical protein